MNLFRRGSSKLCQLLFHIAWVVHKQLARGQLRGLAAKSANRFQPADHACHAADLGTFQFVSSWSFGDKFGDLCVKLRRDFFGVHTGLHVSLNDEDTGIFQRVIEGGDGNGHRIIAHQCIVQPG